MTTSFQIKKICNESNRPPYSYKVDRYFEQFVTDQILSPLHLITGNVLLSVMILPKEEVGAEGIAIHEPTTLQDEQLTFYPVSILLEDVYNGGNVMENIVSLYFQVISLFFRNYFPAVSAEYLLSIKDKIDWDALLAIPYPAAYYDQQYVGDHLLKSHNQ